MAFKIDEVMDLSLDDYIAISKKSTFNNAVTKNTNHEQITINDKSKDVKFGRRRGNIDDEDEDDEDDFSILSPKEVIGGEKHVEEIDIWKGPDSSTSYLDCNDQRNDLREKLNSNKVSYPKFNSVQYRLMAPNNASDRPRGIPTLLPLDVQVRNKNWVNHKGRRNGGNRANRGLYNFQRGFENARNNGNNPNTGMSSVSNGRVQRNRKNECDSKNFRLSVARNNKILGSSGSYHKAAQNLLIETPSSCINLVSSQPLNASFHVPHQGVPGGRLQNNLKTYPAGNLTPQAEAVMNLNSQNVSLTAGSNNDSLKHLLGFQGNVSGEMMPIFASRLMEYLQSGLQNSVVHKPVYDMKIQKDIHEIQKKPLLYKCPGGEVVSSDGAGVNCKIIPRTSGVSLNCRFA